MCGRFALINNPLLLMSLFDLPPEDGFKPVYNIAPSFRVLSAYKEDEKIVLGRKTWNFKPHWAKQEMKSVINARTETALKNHTFAVQSRSIDVWFRLQDSMNGNRRGRARKGKLQCSFIRKISRMVSYWAVFLKGMDLRSAQKMRVKE